MPNVGLSSQHQTITPGTTHDFTITRDRLIEMAAKCVGLVAPGEVLDGEMLQDGKDLLNLIVRETDASGRWRWTIDVASTLTLAANTFVYTSSSGLPTNIAELLTAYYHNAAGQDLPMKILKAEGYEAIPEKMKNGDPTCIYLTEHRDITERQAFVYPMLSSVNTQSVVLGTDGANYKCIRSHTADTTNCPITGANYLLFWEAGGTSPSTWAAETNYTAPQLIRLLYRRPIFDFDGADDHPDFPRHWPRLLMFRLAGDLGDFYGVPESERDRMIGKAKASFEDGFQTTKAKSSTLHGKASYF